MLRRCTRATRGGPMAAGSSGSPGRSSRCRRPAARILPGAGTGNHVQARQRPPPSGLGVDRSTGRDHERSKQAQRPGVLTRAIRPLPGTSRANASNHVHANGVPGLRTSAAGSYRTGTTLTESLLGWTGRSCCSLPINTVSRWTFQRSSVSSLAGSSAFVFVLCS